MEPHFITEYRSWVGFGDCNGYNVTKGGEGCVGYRKTTEAIESHRQQLKGRKQTAEHIRKRTLARLKNPDVVGWNKGKTMSLEFGKAISESLKGVPKSEEHKKAMRLRPQDTEMLTCPHCNKSGDYKNMKRWHMDNCKNNPTRPESQLKMVTCQVCGHTVIPSANFYRYHNQHCKFKEG